MGLCKKAKKRRLGDNNVLGVVDNNIYFVEDIRLQQITKGATMTIIKMTKTRYRLKQAIARYYCADIESVDIDSYGYVRVRGKKTKIQTDEYNGVYVAAFIK